MANTNKLIFVYGTLKSGGRLNETMHRIGGVLVGDGRILSRNFVMRDLESYPALQKVEPGSGDYIHGELWLVPLEGIGVLDKIENYPRFYNRMPVDVWSGDPLTSYSAIVYYIKTNDQYGTHSYIVSCPVVKSGEWEAVQNLPLAGDSSERGEAITEGIEDTDGDVDNDSFDTSNTFTCDRGIYITSEYGELFGPYSDIEEACQHIDIVAEELGSTVRMLTIGFRLLRKDLDDWDLGDLETQINHI